MNRRDWNRAWTRDNEITETLLSLVSDTDADLATIEGWTDEQCREADWWATMTHLRASDNPVRSYPRPDFIPRRPSSWVAGETGVYR